MSESSKPWYWCRPCGQPVDIGDEVHDGGEVQCIGCGRTYVCVAFPDDEWMLCEPAVIVEDDGGPEPDDERAADEALKTYWAMRPFARRAIAAVVGAHVPGPHSNAWGSARRMRLSGKYRLSRTRERAQMRRAKMRGRRGADKLRLRGGTIDAAGGLFGFAWWVGTPEGWPLLAQDKPDVLVWEAAKSHGYDEEVAACLYCRGVAECEFHPFPF